ncbi:MAG: thiamine phosphate synthase [Clostridia bacterium]
MRADKKELLLYAITDRTWLNGRTLLGDIEKAIDGGATIIQLREKNMSDEDFLSEAVLVNSLCKKKGVKLIINDNISIMLRSGADGVHIGQHDSDVFETRKRIGENKILGVSAQTLKQGKSAEYLGADYLGVGAVFPTSSKDDADAVSFDTLTSIAGAVKIPTVAIGGINADNIVELSGTGIVGVAVISAIFAHDDIKNATEELKRRCKLLICQK